MPDMNPAPQTALPSSRSLLRSTAIAIFVAAVLLVTVVLPAEYGVDPTRVGRLLGLTEMGAIKVTLAREAARADSIEAAAGATTRDDPQVASPATPPATESAAPEAGAIAANSHVTEIVLQPNEGQEIKLVMRQGARVTYKWSTDGGVVNYDTHGDAPGIRYHAYANGTGRPSDEGVLVAAFDGAHGWFWRNRGREVVTVSLRTSGEYLELKRM